MWYTSKFHVCLQLTLNFLVWTSALLPGTAGVNRLCLDVLWCRMVYLSRNKSALASGIAWRLGTRLSLEIYSGRKECQFYKNRFFDCWTVLLNMYHKCYTRVNFTLLQLFPIFTPHTYLRNFFRSTWYVNLGIVKASITTKAFSLSSSPPSLHSSTAASKTLLSIDELDTTKQHREK